MSLWRSLRSRRRSTPPASAPNKAAHRCGETPPLVSRTDRLSVPQSSRNCLSSVGGLRIRVVQERAELTGAVDAVYGAGAGARATKLVGAVERVHQLASVAVCPHCNAGIDLDASDSCIAVRCGNPQCGKFVCPMCLKTHYEDAMGQRVEMDWPRAHLHACYCEHRKGLADPAGLAVPSCFVAPADKDIALARGRSARVTKFLEELDAQDAVLAAAVRTETLDAIEGVAQLADKLVILDDDE